ncbi:MAG: RES domain-containing protein [Solirubrobacteraceae bacterium]
MAAAPLLPFTGQDWRQIAPRYDPLSGEGARLHGGRFNPPGSFPVLYICQSRPCAAAELKRLGERQAIGVEGLLPRLTGCSCRTLPLSSVSATTSSSESLASWGSSSISTRRAGSSRSRPKRRAACAPSTPGFGRCTGVR